ncbi:MAG: polyamine ABC transporter ATP-binding protein, partial [Deltaproteobacteria bacterium]|nr:polyamine ABC transporter ATP-binding protein [Deltaproteobacteria bacterium]
MDSKMISVRGVSKRFYTQSILNHVSFEVGRGESFVILGQSGVGKSV